ncbi:hypothetical protein D046_4355B, partial [Vibrio parahaemolyticus V-223/04]
PAERVRVTGNADEVVSHNLAREAM